MSAVRPPTLWLSVAATAISAVAVAAMANSDGPRRPLTFAGAILVPDSHYSAASQPAGKTTRPSRPSAPGTATRPSSAPSAAVSPAQYQPPAASVIPAQNTSAAQGSSRTPGQIATPSSPSVAGASASRPAHPVGTPRTGIPGTPAPDSSPTALAQALFSALNTARKQAGLPPLSWSPGLKRSAASHNQAMATANQLTSRVGDEPALGVRQANQGVAASFTAESLGYAPNLGNAQSSGLAGALAVQQQMLAEQPPDDSRRQNLLSAAVNAVGIDVLLDPAHGRVWVTEDFARLS
ncbi:CAP domain-containing protein [Jatrophihabitans sp.]|jgi:uncharacterized protein YkwD|uniref:CAP domain-containing protein n=1 Tax=Jatrophihabitans sp. TaxID=1932789 RepID=UPI002EF1CD7D